MSLPSTDRWKTTTKLQRDTQQLLTAATAIARRLGFEASTLLNLEWVPKRCVEKVSSQQRKFMEREREREREREEEEETKTVF